MSNEIKPFGRIERAIKALLERELEDPPRIGGEFSFDSDTETEYTRIDRVLTTSDRFEGDFLVSIENFASDPRISESRALAVEAIMLGYPWVVEVDGSMWVFDKVSQNVGVQDLPEEDEAVSRLGATYVITARRR